MFINKFIIFHAEEIFSIFSEKEKVYVGKLNEESVYKYYNKKYSMMK